MAAIIIGRMRIIKTMPTMRPTLGEDWTTTGFEGRSTAAKKIKRVRKKEEEHNSKMKLKKKTK